MSASLSSLKCLPDLRQSPLWPRIAATCGGAAWSRYNSATLCLRSGPSSRSILIRIGCSPPQSRQWTTISYAGIDLESSTARGLFQSLASLDPTNRNRVALFGAVSRLAVLGCVRKPFFYFLGKKSSGRGQKRRQSAIAASVDSEARSAGLIARRSLSSLWRLAVRRTSERIQEDCRVESEPPAMPRRS